MFMIRHIKFQIPGFQGQVVFVIIWTDKNENVCIMIMFYVIQ